MDIEGLGRAPLTNVLLSADASSNSSVVETTQSSSSLTSLDFRYKVNICPVKTSDIVKACNYKLNVSVAMNMLREQSRYLNEL